MRGEPSIRFPSWAHAVFREAEQFRQQTPSERFLIILDLIASGESLLRDAPCREQAHDQRADDEQAWRRIHRELFTRHGI